MSQKPEHSPHIDELMNAFFAQAKAQFGPVVKTYWFYDGDLCPGCARPTDGVMKSREKAPCH